METQWDRVARWARMGNNKKETDEMRSEEAMQDQDVKTEMQEPLEGEIVTEVAPVAEQEQGEQPGLASAADLDQARGERDQLRDRLARLQAEFDNSRKREAKERQDSRDYTVSATVEPFLGVMDNFHLALKADGSAEQLRAGVELILKQMEEALRGLNVQAVESVGSQFDPRFHEALGSIETKEFPDHQVLEEVRRGYRIREKLLRPALVRIAANPDQVNDQA